MVGTITADVSVDPTPAVFISDDGALRAAREAVKCPGIRKAVVLPHQVRKGMVGYVLVLHFTDRRRAPRAMSNSEFEIVSNAT